MKFFIDDFCDLNECGIFYIYSSSFMNLLWKIDLKECETLLVEHPNLQVLPTGRINDQYDFFWFLIGL